MPGGRRTVRSRRVAGELRRLRARSGHSCATVGAALGTLQTADYAGAMIVATNPALGEDEVETRVAARIARQALLGRAYPPRLLALLEEGVLRRVVGDPGLIRPGADLTAARTPS